jgi:hypothetical protein
VETPTLLLGDVVKLHLAYYYIFLEENYFISSEGSVFFVDQKTVEAVLKSGSAVLAKNQ